MSTTRKLAAVLAIGALAAPAAAQAKPMDMHASTALTAARAQQKQDLRSADARDAAAHPRPAGGAVNAPGATAVDSQSTRPLAGPPTWPVHPEPVTSAPATGTADHADTTDWTAIALGIAGSLITVGGLGAAINRRGRRPQRVRAAA